MRLFREFAFSAITYNATESQDLTDTKKHQLHEVADHMSYIYQTLSNMYFIEAEAIVYGPHNVDHLLPLYDEYSLFPDVVYLYSILPYVDKDMILPDSAWFYGSGFADFRNASDVRLGRDPFDSDAQPGQRCNCIQPWVTALSLPSKLGGSALYYDSKNHRIWAYNSLRKSMLDLELQIQQLGLIKCSSI